MIVELLETFSDGRVPGVADKQLDEAAAELTCVLPRPIREFYRHSDGLLLGPGMKLLSLTEAVNYGKALFRFDIGCEWRLLPLDDANNSNPFCMACRGPLREKIILVRHDDEPLLYFRSFEGYVNAVRTLAGGSEWWIDEMEPEYAPDHSDRTPEDDQIADQIIATCDLSHTEEFESRITIAIALYSRHRLERIIEFLQCDNMWIRESAAVHLGLMGDRRAIGPLKELAVCEMQDGRAARQALVSLNYSDGWCDL